MRIIALLLALATAAPAGAQAPSPHAIEIPSWFTETFLELRDDVREAAAQGKRVMLYSPSLSTSGATAKSSGWTGAA